MLAGGAYFGCFFPFVYVSAVTTLPFDLFLIFEYRTVYHTFVEFEVAGFMSGFDCCDAAESFGNP